MMEEPVEAIPDEDDEIRAINHGTGAAVTVVTSEGARWPHWVYLAIIIGIDVLAFIVGGVIIFWPHGAL